MNKSVDHLAPGTDGFQMCLRTGWYFIHHHMTMIVLEMRYEIGQWLIFGWFGGCVAHDTHLARRMLGK